MNSGTRAALAAIAAACINRATYSSVLDINSGASHQIVVELSGDTVRAYDHQTNLTIDGQVPGDLYDYKNGNFIEMTRDGSSVNGYHFGDGHFYEGTVSGTSVELYDFGTGSFYLYEVS